LLPARLNHLPQAGGINAIKYLVLEKWTALLEANEVTGFRFLGNLPSSYIIPRDDSILPNSGGRNAMVDLLLNLQPEPL